MERTEIRQEIVSLLSKYQGRGAAVTALTESSSLVDELDINSARMVDIVLDLEDQFKVAIDDDSVQRVVNVGDLVSLIDGLLNGQQRS